jgi:hypothetical protein
MTTAASPIQTALATALLADATLIALLAGEDVYSQATLPAAPTLPYVVLGPVTEGETAVRFQAAGWADGTAQLDVYAADQTAALAIYTRLHALLHRTTLTLSGATLLRGRLSLVTTLADPVGVHLVARYATLAR